MLVGDPEEKEPGPGPTKSKASRRAAKRSQEQELIVDKNLPLAGLKALACESHGADLASGPWRLRKTNGMDDSAGLIKDEHKSCGAELKHGLLVLVERGDPLRPGFINIGLRLWAPARAAALVAASGAETARTSGGNGGAAAGEAEDAATRASRIRSSSVVNLESVRVHRDISLAELKKLIAGQEQFLATANRALQPPEESGGVLAAVTAVAASLVGLTIGGTSSSKPVLPSPLPWRHIRLRHMGPCNIPGKVFRNNNVSLANHRMKNNSAPLVVEVLKEPEDCEEGMSLVIWAQLRDSMARSNEPLWPPKQVVITGPAAQRTFASLTEALEKTFGVAEDQQVIRKYNLKRYCWTELKAPSAGAGKRSRRKKSKHVRRRLDQAPYSLRDGALVVVKDSMTDPDDRDDFMRPEDLCRAQKLRQHRKAHSEHRSADKPRDKQRSNSAEDGVRLNYACDLFEHAS